LKKVLRKFTTRRTWVYRSRNLTQSKHDILMELMRKYRQLVNVCFDIAVSEGITEPKAIYKETYYKLREAFSELPTHYIQTAIRRVSGALKSALEIGCRPKLSTTAILLDYLLFKPEGHHIRIKTHEGFMRIPIEGPKWRLWPFQISLVRRKGFLAISPYRERKWVLAYTVRLQCTPFVPKGLMTFDLNEKSCDLLIISREFGEKRWIHLDHSSATHKLARGTHLRMKGVRHSPRIYRSAHHLLSVETKFIADLAFKWKLAVITERFAVKSMLSRIHRASPLKPRLKSFPFAWFIRTLSDKLSWRCVPHCTVSARWNSRMCPLCGNLAIRKKRIVRCRCGMEIDANLLACINIALRSVKETDILEYTDVPRDPNSVKALVSLNPEWLVVTVKGLRDVRATKRRVRWSCDSNDIRD